jgi:predicted transcriptional regulator
MTRTRIDPAELTRLWHRGLKLTAIARRLGLHPRSVWRCCKRLGLSRKPGAVTRRRVLRLDAAGWSVPRIADHLGVDPNTVRHHLRRAGRPVRRNHAEQLAAWRANVGATGSFGAYVVERQRAAAALAGWPPAVASTVVWFEALYAAGPTTAAKLAAATGRTTHRAQMALTRLRAAGHVVRVGSEKVPGACKPHAVYAMAPAVREGRRQYLAYQEELAR